MWANTEPQGKVIQAAVDKFQEETGAKVTIEWKNRDVKDILNSALESKENIDLFEDDYKRIAQNYAPYVADLSEMAEAAGYADKSYAVFSRKHGHRKRQDPRSLLLLQNSLRLAESFTGKTCLKRLA